METLTKDELIILANLLGQANVPVKDAKPYQELLAKLIRMSEQGQNGAN